MCGLNITLSRNISHMNKCLQHRGISDHTHEINAGGYSFGHVRLPIMGLSHDFDQPYIQGGYIFLFVGEIFNYKELMPGAKSDIEVVVAYWKKYKHDCFKFFDGFWALSVYDIHRDTLYVYTDPLAKKPLYIFNDGETLSISSEIKSLCCSRHFKQSYINDFYFSSVNKWGYHNGHMTFDKFINKLTHNSCLVIEKKRVSGIYTLPAVRRNTHLRLEDKIRAAVERRLVSDIPVSVLVSGGLDSSIIYKIMSQMTDDITVFHYGEEEREYLNYLNIPSRHRVIYIPDIYKSSDIYEKAMFSNESPVDLGSTLIQYQIGKYVREAGFNIVLSGDGADELFGGYRRSLEYDSQLSDIYEELVYYHLPRLDKQMMAHTVEIRCPFLSWDIIDAAKKTSYDKRIDKAILKEKFSHLVPDEIIQRRKHPLKRYEITENPLYSRYENVKIFLEKIIRKYYKGEQK